MNSSGKNKINLILALHNHQPEGNFPDVFRQNYETAYEPFIRELEQFQHIKVVQHYSGILLRWLAENRPTFLDRLRRLISLGQLEMMGGAFYEPILVMIPDDDKIGQIRKQSRFIQENFQTEASGAWLAERVWEPHLTASLAKAGIRYTVLDDAHFKNIGFAEEQTLHYYVTEEAGLRLNIFPISEKLRYLIPFADPKETVDYLQSMATPAGDRVVVLADDGEKFGSWPGTAVHVYEKGWLRQFFELLKNNSDWLSVTTFDQYMQKWPPAGRVYLPAGSYREMMEWSGGYWRNFFVRYPESNHIHKKMLYVRDKLERLPDGPLKKEAQEYLWAGQCNCAYWHGVFGGLYLNFLRSALYNRLIAAEDLVDRATHQDHEWLEMATFDFDYDGSDEILISGPHLGFVLAPALGGALLELDFKPKRFNLLDVLTRRQEPYHCNIYEQAQGVCDSQDLQTIHHITRVKEAGLEQLLTYDDYRRASLLDHFFPAGSNLDNFMQKKQEAGDFIGSPYELKRAETMAAAIVVLSRLGCVTVAEQTWPVLVTKSLSHNSSSGEISYDYHVVNQGKTPLHAVFAIEFNINFLAGNAPDRYYSIPGAALHDSSLASRGALTQLTRFGLTDEWLGLSCMFRFDRPTDIWRMPLETVSQSEDGMERVFQGSTLLFSWEIRLLPGTVWAVTFTQAITELVREVQG